MFLPALQNHIMMSSNLCNMSCMAMNSNMDFMLGVACATAFQPSFNSYSNPFANTSYYATPPTFQYTESASSNPFASSSVFTTPTFSYSNNTGTSNPFSFGNFNYCNNIGSLYNSNYSFGSTGFCPIMPSFNNFSFALNFSLPSSSSSETQGAVSIGYNSSSSKIKKGLLKGNLVGKENVIVQLCKKYNVDVALVLSIIGQESGFGTSNLASHNNFMGYRKAGDLGKNAKGFGYFSTPEKGLEAGIKNLSKYPERYASVKKADMNNIDAIGRIYCEGTSYATAVKKVYNTTVRSYLA